MQKDLSALTKGTDAVDLAKAIARRLFAGAPGCLTEGQAAIIALVESEVERAIREAKEDCRVSHTMETQRLVAVQRESQSWRDLYEAARDEVLYLKRTIATPELVKELAAKIAPCSNHDYLRAQCRCMDGKHAHQPKRESADIPDWMGDGSPQAKRKSSCGPGCDGGCVKCS